jgi:hypothetical protein
LCLGSSFASAHLPLSFQTPWPQRLKLPQHISTGPEPEETVSKPILLGSQQSATAYILLFGLISGKLSVISKFFLQIFSALKL